MCIALPASGACVATGSGPDAGGGDAGDIQGDAPLPPACGGLEIRVRSGDRTDWDPLLVVVDADPWGGVHRAVCGASGRGGDDVVTCTAAGAHVSDTPSTLRLFVLAPGYRSHVATVSPTWEPAPGGDGCPAQPRRATVEVDLVPLPAAEATADYRTAFPGGQEGLDAFVAMAWPASDEMGPVHSVKFYLEDPDGDAKVWFQDTRRNPIHYDFANTVLGRPFTRDQFWQRTYRGSPRPAMAGSILWRPQLSIPLAGEPGVDHVLGVLTVEFFPSDDLTPDQAATAWRLLQERMPFASLAGTGRRLFYLPAGSVQEAQAVAGARGLARAGVTWLRRMDVYGSVTTQYLNPGVAYGTLKILAPEDLVEGAVSFRDVLVLTRLPNELPIVGGTITDELQTPLAHVNLSARARGTPNLALVGASTLPAVQALAGKLVRFEVKAGAYTLVETTLDEAEAFWQKAAGRPPLVPVFDLSRTDLPAFPDLAFADSKAFGAKAANLAEMSHVIPDRTPLGLGVPFHYHDAFLDRAVVDATACDAARTACLADGHPAAACEAARTLCSPVAGATETLRTHVERHLADPGFRTDTPLRAAALAGIRDLFCRLPMDPAFATLLDQRVHDVHGSTKVKLRSSTNAEDLPNFTGAGLYTSVAATWGTAKSPSARICQVWASAWNWAAFEERSFWNVDHLAVRMGVAISTAFPDEQANGVLITRNLLDPNTRGFYVNVQKGEVSVTNPEEGSIPEVFAIIEAPGGVQVARQRFSSLSPGQPLLSEGEIAALYQAASQVANHFAPLYGKSPDGFPFDIEFKFHGPERALFLKQVRPYQQAQVP